MVDSSKKILIVEDSADLRFLMKTILKREKYEVAEAKNGVDALTALNNGPYELILLDMSLPDMNGADFMNHLKSHSQASRVKVIVISGWDNLAAHAKEIGAHSYLRKPIDADSLLSEVKKYI